MNMKYLETIINASKEVYSTKRYCLLTLLSALLLVSLNAVMRNYQLLFKNFSFSLLLSLIYGLITSFTPLALILLVIISLLGGAVVTFSVYLIRRQIALQASAGIPGILIAILAPACPSCALGLLGLLGISGTLTFLPLQGYEFALLSIILILFSIAYLSAKIVSNICEVR